MSGEPIRFDALLESVADGDSLDWDALEAAADDDQRRLLRHLRVVASVAEVHRTVPVEHGAPAFAPLMDVVAAGHAVPRWGHLLLLEKIGEGAFGEVYRARDPWLDREVALKLLRPRLADRAPDSRLVAEGRALARVRHPNVVTVYGADMHDGRAGLWMELVRGRTLAQIVAAQGPFGAAEAAVIGQEICRALSAVHAAGLVHRDVKAQNVMREAGGRLVLMDFGAGQTPLYLAPELLPDGGGTTAGDIYALGVLLYHLVTGRYPVTGASIEDLHAAHADGERRRLGDVRPDLSDGFVAAVERAVQPDPAQRYASAREMQDALARVISPGTARRPAMVAVPRWSLAARAAVAAAAALGVGLAAWTLMAPARPLADSVAVLPFRAIGSDPETIFYSEGLSEDLTAQLARLASVRVASVGSARRYRDAERAPAEIGRELQVAALISGSVRLSDDQMRIVVEVIDAARATQLWAGTFERPRGDVVTVQNEVIHRVAEALRGTLSDEDAARLERPQPDPRAFDLYLKGRYYSSTRTPDGLKRSIDLFNQAMALDPHSALPYAGLADAHLLTAFYNIERPRVAYARADWAAGRAIELDTELAEAYAALGFVRTVQLRWADAEIALKRAIELNPSYASAHHWYALWLAQRGRSGEALEALRKARAVDPYSRVLRGATGYVLYASRRFDEALDEYKQVLDVEPANLPAHFGIIETLAARGSVSDARRALEEAARLTGRPEDLRLSGAYVYALAHETAEARRLLTRVIAGIDSWRASPAEVASVYAALGEMTQALEWLERAAEEHDTLLGYIPIDPRFDRMRGHERFDAVLAAAGLM